MEVVTRSSAFLARCHPGIRRHRIKEPRHRIQPARRSAYRYHRDGRSSRSSRFRRCRGGASNRLPGVQNLPDEPVATCLRRTAVRHQGERLASMRRASTIQSDRRHVPMAPPRQDSGTDQRGLKSSISTVPFYRMPNRPRTPERPILHFGRSMAAESIKATGISVGHSNDRHGDGLRISGFGEGA